MSAVALNCSAGQYYNNNITIILLRTRRIVIGLRIRLENCKRVCGEKRMENVAYSRLLLLLL